MVIEIRKSGRIIKKYGDESSREDEGLVGGVFILDILVSEMEWIELFIISW